MEKKVMSYDLDAVKRTFSTVGKLRITASGLRDARSMGFTQQDILNVVQQLRRSDFVKSMTTYSNHRIWQDVYNTEYNGYFLYIKFQADEMGYFVISFKEK